MYDNRYDMNQQDDGYETYGICPCKSNGCSNACTSYGASCMRSCTQTCGFSCSSQCSWIKVVQLL